MHMVHAAARSLSTVIPSSCRGRSSGSTQALTKLSVGAQRIHDGLRQQVAPGRRRVDVTGKRGGRHHDA